MERAKTEQAELIKENELLKKMNQELAAKANK
jgi:hypothetical protein